MVPQRDAYKIGFRLQPLSKWSNPTDHNQSIKVPVGTFEPIIQICRIAKEYWCSFEKTWGLFFKYIITYLISIPSKKPTLDIVPVSETHKISESSFDASSKISTLHFVQVPKHPRSQKATTVYHQKYPPLVSSQNQKYLKSRKVGAVCTQIPTLDSVTIPEEPKISKSCLWGSIKVKPFLKIYNKFISEKTTVNEVMPPLRLLHPWKQPRLKHKYPKSQNFSKNLSKFETLTHHPPKIGPKTVNFQNIRAPIKFSLEFAQFLNNSENFDRLRKNFWSRRQIVTPQKYAKYEFLGPKFWPRGRPERPKVYFWPNFLPVTGLIYNTAIAWSKTFLRKWASG